MKFILGLLLAVACNPVFALRPSNVVLMNAVANSGTKVSQVLDAQNIVAGSIQATFSSNLAGGTLVIQCSNDNPSGLYSGTGVPVPVNWSTCPNGSASVGTGTTTYTTLQYVSARWIRVQWTSSAGAGTLTVTGQFQAY